MREISSSFQQVPLDGALTVGCHVGAITVGAIIVGVGERDGGERDGEEEGVNVGALVDGVDMFVGVSGIWVGTLLVGTLLVGTLVSEVGGSVGFDV
ncbi:hypothetical protein M1146_07215 [Patescibacteria group bacterium]|nr:hypothetical protein [Patescibacteria group bacterium]